jgi:hypothetical protein
MKPHTKRIIAREFLILIVVVTIVTLTWLIIYIISDNTKNRYNNTKEHLKTSETILDHLKRNNPIRVPYKFAPLDDSLRILRRVWGTSITDFFDRPHLHRIIIDTDIESDSDFKYRSFTTHPDILNNPEDFFQARGNLIEIHHVIISFDDTIFYKNNRDFNDFVKHLNKDLLTKIYKGITGQSEDFIQIYSMSEKKFSDFLTDIGYDIVTFKPIICMKALNYEKSYEKSITDCENNITSLTNEKIKIEKSSFLHLNIKKVTINVILILFGLVYPLRGVLLMIKWSIKTLRNSNNNRN